MRSAPRTPPARAETAYLCASRYAESYCVKAVGPTSMEVGISIVAEDVKWRCEAELRKELRRRYRQELESGACRVQTG